MADYDDYESDEEPHFDPSIRLDTGSEPFVAVALNGRAYRIDPKAGTITKCRMAVKETA